MANRNSSDQKLRMTRQRRVILEEIRKLDCHPTADEVYEAVRKRLPRISMSTIYRDLEALCDWGKIQVLEVGCSKKHFDADTKDHYHVRCARCGRVENLPVQPFSYLERAFRDLCDYEVIGHRLELLGLCPACQKAKEYREAAEGIIDIDEVSGEEV